MPFHAVAPVLVYLQMSLGRDYPGTSIQVGHLGTRPTPPRCHCATVALICREISVDKNVFKGQTKHYL